MQTCIHQRSTLSILAFALFISACFFISACGETANEAPASNTVLSAPQQQGLAAAKQMEQQLQQDMERREQQMRDEGI